MSRKTFFKLKEKLDSKFEGREHISKKEVEDFCGSCPELDTSEKRKLFVDNLALYE
ncbi:MAG: hypothetical protein WCX17_00715 [Parcubacteria group bacterium]